MALKQQFSTPVISAVAQTCFGNISLSNIPNVDLGECYIKISSISGSKSLLTIQVQIQPLSEIAEIEARKLELEKLNSPLRMLPTPRTIINQYSFSPNLDANSPNFLAQGYAFLKTQEQFNDAVDC